MSDKKFIQELFDDVPYEPWFYERIWNFIKRLLGLHIHEYENWTCDGKWFCKNLLGEKWYFADTKCKTCKKEKMKTIIW